MATAAATNMPKVRRTGIPPALFVHLADRRAKWGISYKGASGVQRMARQRSRGSLRRVVQAFSQLLRLRRRGTRQNVSAKRAVAARNGGLLSANPSGVGIVPL